MITAQIRDIAIIIVAVQSIVIGVLIAVLIFQIWRLMKIIQSDVQPIIKDTQETIGTVRGTANFVSENVVSPVMKTQGFVAGTRRTIQVLRAGLGPRKRPEKAISKTDSAASLKNESASST